MGIFEYSNISSETDILTKENKILKLVWYKIEVDFISLSML